MDDLAYAAALLLAAVFAWAGVAKLVRRRITERAFRSLTVPAPGALAVAVPAGELALAAGLVVVPGWAAVATLAVLAGFTTVVVRGLQAGARAGCGCFGTSSPRPVSTVDVVRNALLGMAAVAATFAPGPLVPDPSALGVVVAMAATGVTLLALLGARQRAASRPPRRQATPRA